VDSRQGSGTASGNGVDWGLGIAQQTSEIVPLEIRALRSRLLRLRHVPEQSDCQHRHCHHLSRFHVTRTKRKAIANIQQYVLIRWRSKIQWMEFSEPTRGRTSARSVCNSVAFAAGLQGWRVVNNNIETKVNTLATSEK
jgi:hypothetical protein